MRRFAHLCQVERRRRGWSQRELGRALGCSQANITKIENLQGGTVGLKLVERAVELFQLDPDYFFDPGPAELDPAEYDLGKRRTLAQRLEILERAARGRNKEPESGPRPVTPHLPTPKRR